MDSQALRDAFAEARSVLRSANMSAAAGVEFAAGRLRRLGLDNDTLRALKSELGQYNAKRGKWSRR